MNPRPAGLFRLLWSHARPFAAVLVVVVGLSAVSAFLQQGTYLLLEPVWSLMFPDDPTLDAFELEALLAEVPATTEGTGGAELEAVRELVGDSAAALRDAGAEDEPSLVERWRERLTGWIVESPETMSDGERMRLLLLVAGLIGIIAFAASVAGYFATLLASRAGLGMVVSLRMRLARHLMKLSLRYHGQRKLGDLLSRTTADVGVTLQVVNLILRDLVQQPLMAATALGWALIISWQATLLVVLGMPLLLVPVSLLLRKVRRGSTQSLVELGASAQVLAQIMTGIRTVKAFRAEERELEGYQKVNDAYVGATMRMVRAGALSGAWSILYTHLGLGIVVVLVGWLTINGNMVSNGGEMLTFFMLISKAYTSLKKTTRTLGSVAEAQGACERLQAILDEEPEIHEDPGARTLEGLGSGLRFEGMTFTYPDGHGNAIEDLDLELRPGETLALVGPSGAGKSTLIDLVARFIDPSSGRITANGIDLRELSIDSWTAQYAMVTQSPFLFHTTIAENIRYGKPGATLAELEQAARAANIHEFIADLPDGYETDVADAGARLSGGQRQRITIARAILKGAPLLLLDEATSALDTESEQVVQAALDNLMEGHTVIVIAHRLSTIRDADRIAVLDEGRLVELGSHEELLAHGGLYARLHRMQFRDGDAHRDTDGDGNRDVV